jgi:hypothetical protein
MTNRRRFIKRTVGLGAALPLLTNSLSKASGLFSIGSSIKAEGPMILCSRGEYWGKKILSPAQEIFENKGELLDAIEKAANVTELDPWKENHIIVDLLQLSKGLKHLLP